MINLSIFDANRNIEKNEIVFLSVEDDFEGVSLETFVIGIDFEVIIINLKRSLRFLNPRGSNSLIY